MAKKLCSVLQSGSVSGSEIIQKMNESASLDGY
jgi:hypothetical protein